MTATFKHRKRELALEGFDPALTRDAIYFHDPASNSYVPLDAALHARLAAGTVRL